MQEKIFGTVDMSFCCEGFERQKRVGKARTSDGKVMNGIFHKVFRRSEQTLLYIRGYRLHLYSYPLIHRQFSSPMSNDYNILFVGGWIPCDADGSPIDTHDNLLHRVVSGLKPMGWTGIFKSHPDGIGKIKELQGKAQAAGLATVWTEEEDRYTLSFCAKGRMDRLFDLNALQADYLALCKAEGSLTKWVEDRFASVFDQLREESLENLLHLHFEPEEGSEHFIKVGLCLGFPPETTFSRLVSPKKYEWD